MRSVAGAEVAGGGHVFEQIPPGHDFLGVDQRDETSQTVLVEVVVRHQPSAAVQRDGMIEIAECHLSREVGSQFARQGCRASGRG